MYPPTEPKPKGRINPSKVCHNQNCRYCPKLDHSSLIKSTTTGRTFIVPSKITCKFNNLIYLITCKQFQSQNVGQTMKSIQMRFQKHLKDVEPCSNWAMAPPSIKAQGPTNVGFHFSHTGHSIQDIQINVLEIIHLDPNSTTTKFVVWNQRTIWIHKLKTLKTVWHQCHRWFQPNPEPT